MRQRFPCCSLHLQFTKCLVVRRDGKQRWVLEGHVPAAALNAFQSPMPPEEVVHEHARQLCDAIRRALASRSKYPRRRRVVSGFRSDVFRFLFGEQGSRRRLVNMPVSSFPTQYFPPSFHCYTSPSGSRYYADISLRWRLATSPPTHYTTGSDTACTIQYILFSVCQFVWTIKRKV